MSTADKKATFNYKSVMTCSGLLHVSHHDIHCCYSAVILWMIYWQLDCMLSFSVDVKTFYLDLNRQISRVVYWVNLFFRSFSNMCTHRAFPDCKYMSERGLCVCLCMCVSLEVWRKVGGSYTNTGRQSQLLHRPHTHSHTHWGGALTCTKHRGFKKIIS